MRLTEDSPEKEEEVEATLAYIQYTTEMEAAETENASFFECFSGTNLRRTEIVSDFALSLPDLTLLTGRSFLELHCLVLPSS